MKNFVPRCLIVVVTVLLTVLSLVCFHGAVLSVQLFAQQQTTLNWQRSTDGLPSVSPPPRTVNINAFIEHQSNVANIRLLFAGTAGAGAYRSSDTGRTWVAVNTGLNDVFVRGFASAGIALFAGTNNGVFQSFDNGSNWSIVGGTFNGLADPTVNALVVTSVNLNNNVTIYAATSSGVYRTVGTTGRWEGFSRGLPARQSITSLAVMGNYLFAGTSAGGAFRLRLDSAAQPNSTNNFSLRWVDMGLPLVRVSGFAVSNNSILAATFGSGIFRSLDSGATWRVENAGLQNLNISSITSLGAQALVTVPGDNVYSATVPVDQFSQTQWSASNTGTPVAFATQAAFLAGRPFVSVSGVVSRGTVFARLPPVISTVTPSSVPANPSSGDVSVTISGRNFDNAVVSLNGVPLQITAQGLANVVATIPASLLADDGVRVLQVQNIDRQTARTNFTVSGPTAPFIVDIEPDSIRTQSAPTQMIIRGQTFLDSNTASINGVPLRVDARFGSGAIMLVTVPTEALAIVGRTRIRVTNPSGQFHEFPFTVRALPPRISSITPPVVSLGIRDFTLTINGANFFTTATVGVFVNNARLRLNSISSTRAVVTVPGAYLSSLGTFSVVLQNDDGQTDSTQIRVVPFGLTPITAPQTVICPGSPTPLTAVISGGVAPFIARWSPAPVRDTIDGTVIRAIVAPTQPTEYRLVLEDAGGVTTSGTIRIGILQPQATAPQAVAFDTVNTFFRLSTTQSITFRNVSPDSTTLVLGTPQGRTTAFAVTNPVSGIRVPFGQTVEIPLTFTPPNDGFWLDTVRIPFGPCDRIVSVIVSGFRRTPVLPPPPLIPVTVGAAGTVPVGAAPQLSWLPVGFLSVPSSYNVQIARVESGFRTDSGFTLPLHRASVSQTSTQPAFTLQPNTAYTWSVQATNSVTTSTWSTPLYFITPPAAGQRTALSPTRIDFGTGIVGETEQRGTQITTTNPANTPVQSVEFFPPSNAPRGVFSVMRTLAGAQTSQRIPYNLGLAFRPADTTSYQGVMRVRAGSDTLWVLLGGRGVPCIPLGNPFAAQSCAQTDIVFRFAPFKNNQSQPDPGDTVTLQIVLRGSAGLDAAPYASRAQRFNAEVWITKPDVLFPFAVRTPANLTAQQATVSRTRIRLNDIPVNRGTRISDVVLAEIRAEALLADTLTTAIQFGEFVWTDAAQGDVNIRRTLRDTTLTVNTCVIDGTPRLLRPRNPVALAMQPVKPNPATDEFIVSFSLKETSSVEVFLVDVMGRKIKIVTEGLHSADAYTLPVSTRDLQTGTYLLIVQTPHETISQQLVILGR